MFLLEGSVIAHAILQVSVCMCVGWCVLVCVRSCVLVGMCRQRCALIVARCACACPCISARVNACSSKVTTLPRKTADVQKRAPLPPATVSRPSKAKVRTLPRKTAGVQKRAATARVLQSTPFPPEHAPATVSRPARPKVRTFQHKTVDVQKRAPLPPEPSRARPCHGAAWGVCWCEFVGASWWCELVSWRAVTVLLGVLVCVGWCELVVRVGELVVRVG